MNRLRSLLLLSLLLVVGCARAGEGSGLLVRASVPTFPAPPGPAAIVSVTELAEEPAAFAGQYVQVTGQYQPPAVIVCDGELRRSPAMWTIEEGETAIEAGGFEELLNVLLPRQATLTVAGRWLYWQGPAGCGKSAPVREVWYLAVQEIVDPHPLVRATLVPTDGVIPTSVVDARLPTSTPSPSPSPTSTATSPPGGTTTATPALLPSPTTGTGTPSPTATAAVTATATLTATITRGGTAEPTATLEPSAATATAEAGPTPQATATETSGTTLDRGTLSFEPVLGNPANFSPIALELDELGEDEIHRWTFDARAGEVITASVAAQPDRDLVLQLRDFAGNVIITQNESGTSDVETIGAYAIPSEGTYQLTVHEVNGAGAYYALLYLNSEYSQYYNYEIAGVLPRNGSRTASMPENTDYLWLFVATGGSTVTITVAPSDATDPILNLLNPDRNLLFEYVNDRGPGQSEIILNARLEDSGLYILHVGEDQYAASNYRVTVSGN